MATKQEKLNAVKCLLQSAFTLCMDLKDEMRNQLKAVLLAEKVEDVEEVQDPELYKICLDLEFNGQTISQQAEYYLMREDVGLLDPKTMKPIREAEGFFVTDLIRAKKWTNKSLAEFVCAGYEGAQVETIKTGEVLKSDRK